MEDKKVLAAKLGDLERIDDIGALPPHRGAERSSATGDVNAGGDFGLPAEELELFRKAGWEFVGPTAPGFQLNARPVFRDRDGHVKIDSGYLNVRFREDVSPDEIDRLLHDHGLAITRKLGFSPNLFMVGVAGDQPTDTVATARTLSSSETVEYAEPVLIEGLPSRTPGR